MCAAHKEREYLHKGRMPSRQVQKVSRKKTKGNRTGETIKSQPYFGRSLNDRIRVAKVLYFGKIFCQ
jgi:hypothetical protein